MSDGTSLMSAREVEYMVAAVDLARIIWLRTWSWSFLNKPLQVVEESHIGRLR